VALQLWNQYNFGEDLLYGPRGYGLYYWNASSGVTTRGELLSTLGGTVTITIASPAEVTLTNILPLGTAIQFGTTGALPTGITAGTTYYVYNPSIDGYVVQLQDASGNVVVTSGSQSGTQYISNLVDVPLYQNSLTVSDTSRFTIVFGTNDYGSTTADPMLIRWSDQNNPYAWTPNITNQAGSVRLSHGSEIITAIQSPWAACLSVSAAFAGIGLDKLSTFPVPARVYASEFEDGTVAGDPLPSQCAGLISWRTALAGKRNRGRTYMPFPAEADNAVTEFPSADYQARLQTLASTLENITLLNTEAGDIFLRMQVNSVAGNTFTDVDGYLIRAKWATQRRRGQFGRPNALPF